MRAARRVTKKPLPAAKTVATATQSSADRVEDLTPADALGTGSVVGSGIRNGNGPGKVGDRTLLDERTPPQ